MFWHLWCERMQFLNPDDPGSSRTETSAASSTTNSTLYLLTRRKIMTRNGRSQLWCKFWSGEKAVIFCQLILVNTCLYFWKYFQCNMQKWTDRNLFLGANFHEGPLNYKPIVFPTAISQFMQRGSRSSLAKDFKTKM